MKVNVTAAWCLLTALLLIGCSEEQHAPAFSSQELLPAGTATGDIATRTFVMPAANLSIDDEFEFYNGLSFFRDPWVAAPAATSDRDGLGPLFNARSCIACHQGGGRGKPITAGVNPSLALLIRLGMTGTQNQFPATYGPQLQPFAIRLSHPSLEQHVLKEGDVEVSYRIIDGMFADGEPYQLQQPSYRLTNLNYGELPASVTISPRYAPAVYGMGLLDAISTDDLLSQQDIEDSDNDGISAKYNWVPNLKTGEIEIGRFGFKALQPNLAQQVAAAFSQDIGISNSWFADDVCSHAQSACLQAAKLGKQQQYLEIPDKLHDLTIYFSQLITVPKARKLQSAKAQRGRELFYQAACHKCHTPSYITAEDYPITELAGQTIWPYTDLALHDMGEGLSDGKQEFLASKSEWRTPPLWGIGLQNRVQGFQAYLHDGRARTVSEAILWHGGEGDAAKQRFVQFSKQEREALVYFIQQL